jgi:acyl carrier protein
MTIEQTVCGFAAHYAGKLHQVLVTPSSKLADLEEAHSADSLVFIAFIMDIENEYEIEVSDEKMKTFKTVQNVIDYVTSETNHG